MRIAQLPIVRLIERLPPPLPWDRLRRERGPRIEPRRLLAPPEPPILAPRDQTFDFDPTPDDDAARRRRAAGLDAYAQASGPARQPRLGLKFDRRA